MLKTKKKEVVEEMENIYSNYEAIMVTHYHGLTVTQISDLRVKLREAGAGYKVVKNTLSKIAGKKIGNNDFADLFSGPVGVAYANDPVVLAKNLTKFKKDHDVFSIVGGYFNDEVLDENRIKQISSLPSLDEARGKIIGAINAVGTKIVRVLQAPASQLARVLDAKSQKNN